MEFERNEGKTLTCVATPESDVTIEADIEVEEGVSPPPGGGLRRHRGGARRTSPARPAGSSIDLDHEMTFNAGQYVTIEVPGDGTSPAPTRWPTRPGEPGRIELQIRRTPGGLGTDGWVFKDLAVGDTVQLSGPYGRFFLREARTEPAILIGGGTGLAPLKSMVRHALENGPASSACTSTRAPGRRPTSTTSSSSAR